MNRKIDKGTLTRTLLLFVALLNQSLIMFGFTEIPIGEEEIMSAVDLAYLFGSTVFTIVTAVVAWWKDNAISREARAKKAQGGK